MDAGGRVIVMEEVGRGEGEGGIDWAVREWWGVRGFGGIGGATKIGAGKKCAMMGGGLWEIGYLSWESVIGI